MKKLLLLFAAVIFTGKLFAQAPQSTPPPLPSREVSGVVKDTADNVIPGAAVSLTSAKDTLKTITNADGIFVFRNVKVATFFLTVTSLGYQQQTAKRLENDAIPRLVLAPVILKNESRMLNDVVVNGTPSITYKTDTVEYRASDYKVRENATVDELLKKMEGMEVGTDGSVVHMGQAVQTARLNGKLISGGDVASTIQSLPADIVEKIQIVDDYGDEAARTGVKTGDPTKVLNITTKADRSIGLTARLNGGAGSQERYNGQANLTRLNANQTIQFSGNINNTVNGVQGSSGGGQTGGGGGGFQGGGGQGGQRGGGGTSGGGGTGGTGGTTNSGRPSFTYSDDWGKKVEVNMNYGYRYTNTNSFNSSIGEQYSKVKDPLTNQDLTKTTAFSSNSNGDNNNNGHNFNFDLQYEIDSVNFLRVSPTINTSGSLSNTTSSRLETGYRHQFTRGGNSTTSDAPTITGSIFYQHSFTNRRRSFSLNLSNSYSDTERDREQNTNIIYYDQASENILKDSLVHRLIENNNLNKSYRGSMTYVEPLTVKTQLEFNGQVNYRGYDNSAYTSNISATGINSTIDSLSNIFNYSFRETRLAVNYRFGVRQADKTKFSLGVTAVPSVLSGRKVQLNISTRRARLNFIPIARFQYQWSRQKQFALNYSGNFTEPSFDQIQPVRDVSDPQNPVVGNPDLKPTFRHSINASFNNYIANSKLNYSANINTTITSNLVTSNTVQIPDVYGSFKNERRYLNLDGAYAVGGNYNISKQFANRKYNLQMNGTISFNHNVAMTNNFLYSADTWRLNERFGPRINPVEWLEFNPNVSFDFTKNNYSLDGIQDRLTRTLAFNVDGNVEFLKGFEFGYTASKNFISGINTNISSNPFVINTYLERDFLKRKNATFRIQAYDLLKQNNFISRNASETGFTDTQSNALSRYLMFSLRVNLQKWSGTPQRNGRPLQRRGDGSFIN